MFLISAAPALAVPLEPEIGQPVFGGTGRLSVLNEFELGGNFPGPGTIVKFGLRAPVTVS